MARNRHSITLRACALIIDRDKILLVQHSKQGQTYFVLPGGHVEKGESLGQAAIRELKEECGLDLRLGKLMYVGDFITDERHGVDAVFLGRCSSKVLSNENDPDKKYGVITGMKWLALSDLGKVAFRPKALVKEILKDVKHGFLRDDVYVGRYL